MSTPEVNAHNSSKNPYVGPKPFTRDKENLFFGRRADIVNLYAQVASHRTVLFYSQSGAGKSSLLNAGLIPKLEKEGYDVLIAGRLFEKDPAKIYLHSMQ
jgi:ABC-type arginine transport system ATPase subunit